MSMYFSDGRLPGLRILRDKNKEGGDGGGGDNTKLIERLDALEKANKDLQEKLEAKGKKKKVEVDDDDEDSDEDSDEDDLSKQAKIKREADDKKAGETKALQSAIKFNLGSKDFVKTNASLLPKSIQSIFDQADKIVYADDTEKAAAIQVGIVTEFFAVKENLDLLTDSQKSVLEEYLKLTNTVKQERVQSIYFPVFEPVLEMKRKMEKAKALQSGLAESGEGQDAYKNKLLKLSRQHHLGEKNT
jgi:formiminotetrahydrofolate cyclodeaminase